MDGGPDSMPIVTARRPEKIPLLLGCDAGGALVVASDGEPLGAVEGIRLGVGADDAVEVTGPGVGVTIGSVRSGLR
jgi:hypothetical protein